MAVLCESDLTAFEALIEQSNAVRLRRRRDKYGRAVLRVVGKYFPARALGKDAEPALEGFLAKRVYPELAGVPFVVLYVHSNVQRGDNFPGVGAIRAAYDAAPGAVREAMVAVYFLHPGLQSRLYFATIGRFVFGAELYGKIKYVSRIVYLRDDFKEEELGRLPEFAWEHDDELEQRPLMDYGLESGAVMERGVEDGCDRRCHMLDGAVAVEYSGASTPALRCS